MLIVKQFCDEIGFKTLVGRPNFAESDLDKNPVSEEYTIKRVVGNLFCTYSSLYSFGVYANNDTSSNGAKMMDWYINVHIVQHFDIEISNQQSYYENDVGMNEDDGMFGAGQKIVALEKRVAEKKDK